MLRATVSLVFTYLSANQFCFLFLYFHHRPLVSNFSSRAFIRASTLAQLASIAATFAVKLASSWKKKKKKKKKQGKKCFNWPFKQDSSQKEGKQP